MLAKFDISLESWIALAKTPDVLDQKSGLPRHDAVMLALHMDNVEAAELIVHLKKMTQRLDVSDVGYLTTLKLLNDLVVISPRARICFEKGLDLTGAFNLLTISPDEKERLESKVWKAGEIEHGAQTIGLITINELKAIYAVLGLKNESLESEEGIDAKAFWDAARATCRRLKKLDKFPIRKLKPEFIKSAPIEEIIELAKLLINPGCLDRPLVYKHLNVNAQMLKPKG